MSSRDVELLDESTGAVRLQAAVYELRVPADQVTRLDAAQLAGTDFSKFPPDMGEARTLYVVDQRVSLAGDKVMVGSNEPSVTNTRVMANGKTLSSVQYSQVGAIIDFKGERTGPRELAVTSKVEVSANSDSGVEMAEGITTPVTRSAKMSLQGPVELGKPVALVSGDATSRDADGRAVVFVTRMVLGAAAAK